MLNYELRIQDWMHKAWFYALVAKKLINGNMFKNCEKMACGVCVCYCHFKIKDLQIHASIKDICCLLLYRNNFNEISELLLQKSIQIFLAYLIKNSLDQKIFTCLLYLEFRCNPNLAINLHEVWKLWKDWVRLSFEVKRKRLKFG